MGTTYVVFDGDRNGWAYGYMKGWKANQRIDFDFSDAHELDNMTGRAQDEFYVKQHLKERMKKSTCVLVIIGESTKNLYKYVRWELELALEMGLPIVAVNLNNKNGQDNELCPAIIRDSCVVHIPFKLAAIKYALANWPTEFRGLNSAVKNQGWRYYKPELIS